MSIKDEFKRVFSAMSVATDDVETFFAPLFAEIEALEANVASLLSSQQEIAPAVVAAPAPVEPAAPAAEPETPESAPAPAAETAPEDQTNAQEAAQ